MPHSGHRMEVSSQKRFYVASQVIDMLSRKNYGRHKSLQVACKPPSAELDHRLLIVIKNKTILASINSKLVNRRTHLRGKSEISRSAIFFIDDYSQFINDFGFAQAPEKRARKSMRRHFGRLARQELRYPGDPVTDDIVQQLPRQPANPMVPIRKKRLCIATFERVTVVAFHVYGAAAKVTIFNQSSHPSRCMAKLKIVPDG